MKMIHIYITAKAKCNEFVYTTSRTLWRYTSLVVRHGGRGVKCRPKIESAVDDGDVNKTEWQNIWFAMTEWLIIGDDGMKFNKSAGKKNPLCRGVFFVICLHNFSFTHPPRANGHVDRRNRATFVGRVRNAVVRSSQDTHSVVSDSTCTGRRRNAVFFVISTTRVVGNAIFFAVKNRKQTMPNRIRRPTTPVWSQYPVR